MKRFLLISALAAATLCSAVTTSYSPPSGAITVTLAAPVNGVPKITPFSPAVRMPVANNFSGPVYGTVASVTTTTITDNVGGWTGGALSQAATPFFIRMLSGAASGTWWQISTSTANTANVLTILPRAGTNPSAMGVAPGDTYQIVPGDTLSILFGSIQNLMGDTSVTLADSVQIFDGLTWHAYWFNTTAGQWREGGTAFNKSNVVIPPDSGVFVSRNHAGTASLVMLGSVSTKPEQIIVPVSGVTIVGNVFPTAKTLSSLSINTMTGFVANTGSLATADQVVVFDGTIWHSYNYLASASQWREGATIFNKNSVAIPFGYPILISRGTGAAGGPNQLTLTPPYSL
jgi:uncharacterized protein (TIGR02597 family)